MIECGGKDGAFFNDPDYESCGVKLLGGYCFEPAEGDTNKARTAFLSPGHNSAYYDAETGRYFLVFHTRYAGRGEMYRVRVHQMMMNEEGWPAVLPQRYAGEMPEPVEAEKQAGAYKVILHGRDINKTGHSSQTVTLHADGTVTGDLQGNRQCPDRRFFRMELNGTAYTGVINQALDEKQKQWIPCFSALDASGAALWGTGTVPSAVSGK